MNQIANHITRTINRSHGNSTHGRFITEPHQGVNFSRRTTWTLITACFIWLCVGYPVAAQDTLDTALKVVITKVKGIVNFREHQNNPWQRPEVGQQIGVGAELRTGPHSAVRFRIGQTQTITLDRLGTIVVLEAIHRQAGKVKTDVGMKYGRTRYNVEAGGVEHESTIHSPGATLAVRGTLMGLDVDNWRTVALVDDGAALLDPFAFPQRPAIEVGAKGAKTEMLTQHGTPGRSALLKTYVEPLGGNFPRNGDELEAINQNPSLGNTIAGNKPMKRRKPFPHLPVHHNLLFALVWIDGRDDINAPFSGTDVDLRVFSPAPIDLTLGPKPPDELQVFTGGKHNGDRTGIVGHEDVAWLNWRPGGDYLATATLLTPGSAKVFFLAERDKVQLKLPRHRCGRMNTPILLDFQNNPQIDCLVKNTTAVLPRRQVDMTGQTSQTNQVKIASP